MMMIMMMIMVKIMVMMGKIGMMGMMVIRRRMRTIFNIMIMAIDDGDFVTKERSRLFVRS